MAAGDSSDSIRLSVHAKCEDVKEFPSKYIDTRKLLHGDDMQIPKSKNPKPSTSD